MRSAIQRKAVTWFQKSKRLPPFSRNHCSSVAVEVWGHDDDREKHCPSCTCASHPQEKHSHIKMPPPLPEPKYSVHKRVLPGNLTPLNSLSGRQLLKEALASPHAESYWRLVEHFINQSDPAYCGVTSLCMALNAMSIDPLVRWRGGWRYYANEDVLLDRCCLNSEVLRRIGITMDQFCTLATCHGVNVSMKRADDTGIEVFRENVKNTVSSTHNTLVASFSRASLGQTGDGHFSPVAAYHLDSDQVLIMDVARFKYPPYWCSIEDLHKSMVPTDEATLKSRGWFVLEPRRGQQKEYLAQDEQRLPANLVREVGQSNICPLGEIKIEYCKAKNISN